VPDEIIDDAAIRIVPDFSQFRAEFDAQRAQLQATIKKLEIPVDTSGVAQNFRLRLAEMQRVTKEAAAEQTRTLKAAAAEQARNARDAAAEQTRALRAAAAEQARNARAAASEQSRALKQVAAEQTRLAREAARVQAQADRDRQATIDRIAKAETAAYAENLRRVKASAAEQTKIAVQAAQERAAATKKIAEAETKAYAVEARRRAEQQAQIEEQYARKLGAFDRFRAQRAGHNEGRAFNLPFVSQSLPRRYALPVAAEAVGVGSGLLSPLLGAVASAVPVLTGAIPLLASITGLLRENATLATAAGAGWRQFKQDTQGVAIEALVSGVGVLNTFLEKTEPLTEAIGHAFAAVGDDFREALNTKEFQGIFDGFKAEAESGDLQIIGHALVELTAAAGHAVIAFRPLIHDTAVGLDHFAEALNRGAQSAGFREFVQYVRENGHVLADILRQILGIFADLLPAIGALGRGMLQATDLVLRFLHAFTSNPLGEFIASMTLGIALLLRLRAILLASAAYRALTSGLTSLTAAIVGTAGATGTATSRLGALFSTMKTGNIIALATAAALTSVGLAWSKYNSLNPTGVQIGDRTFQGKKTGFLALAGQAAGILSGNPAAIANIGNTTINVGGRGSFDDSSATSEQRQLIETAARARELGISVDGLSVAERRAKIATAELKQEYPGLTQAQAESAVMADRLTATLNAQVAVAQASRTIFDAITDNLRTQGQAQQDVIDAQAAVGAARQQASDDAIQGARDERDAIETVASANRSLRAAQEQQIDAQKALTAARKSAREELISLRRAVRDAFLAEKEAKFGVTDAKAALDQARHTGTGEDIAKAELAVQEATNKSADATTDREKAVSDLNTAEKLGIERAPQVVAAKKAVRDADQAQRDAVRGVRDAEQALADVRKRNARAAITDANNIRKAVSGVQTAQLLYNDAVNSGTKSLDINTAAGLKNVVMLTALAAAINALNKNNPQASKAAFDLIAKQAGFNPKTLAALENTLFPPNPSSQQAADAGNNKQPASSRSVGGNSPVATFAAPSGGVNRAANQNLAHQKVDAKGWGKYWPSFNSLEMGEAGYNNLAQNPTSTAFGIGQFLNSTWATVGGKKTSDPGLQIDYMLKYIQQRYGNPGNAYSAWLSRKPHWYSTGGSVRGPGSTTSDSIPAWLSDGEYVVNAKAHKAIGTETLDHLNAHGFATGGSVNAKQFDSTTRKSNLNIQQWIASLVQITGRGFRSIAQRFASMDLNDFPTFDAARYYASAPTAVLKQLQPVISSANILEGLLEKLPTILKNEPSPGPLRYSIPALQAFAGMTQPNTPFTATNLLPPGGRVLYDTGGLLPSGGRHVQNNTGRPEAVLTERQWQAIYQAATRSGIELGDVHLHDSADVDMLVRKMAFLTDGGAV
jgi:hypothetical protein